MVGIDVGRDWVRVAAADLAGAIVARADAPNGLAAARRWCAQAAGARAEVVAEADLTWVRVAHTRRGHARRLRPATGALRARAEPARVGTPGVMGELREALPPSVAFENDANLAALGEGAYGSGRDARTFVYIAVGSGLGTGIVIDGELYRGRARGGGRSGLRADHGRRVRPRRARPGHAGRGGVGRRGGADREGAGHARRLTAKQVFAAARAGHPVAMATVESEADRLALVVGTVAAVARPRVHRARRRRGRQRGPAAPRGLEERLARLTPLEPRVAEGELGKDAIVLGAIATALDTARDMVFEERAGSAA